MSTSVTESAGIFGGAVGSQNFSYNGSVAISTLNTLTTKVRRVPPASPSQARHVPSPALYQYPIFPYVFGDNPVPGTLQNLNLGTQLQTSGILRAAYTADPDQFDRQRLVARRLLVAGRRGQSPDAVERSADHAYGSTTQLHSRRRDLAQPGLRHLQSSRARHLDQRVPLHEGALDHAAGVNGEGPQLTQATAGAPLLLRTRVYNYSLADMPAGSNIVVQFYGQPWDPNLLVSAGNAFLIDSVQLPPLPGFNSASSGGTTPNWTMASTEKLDTTSYGDQYLVFWVLVYMTDALGLVPEMPGHGLTAIPPTLDSITAAAAFLGPQQISGTAGTSLSSPHSRASYTSWPAGELDHAATGGLGVQGRARRQVVLAARWISARTPSTGSQMLLRDDTPSQQGEPLTTWSRIWPHPRRRRPPREDGVSARAPAAPTCCRCR